MIAGLLGQEGHEGYAGPAGKEAALPFPFFDILDWFFSPAKPARRRSWVARRLFALAGGIAGSGRAALRADWSAVLARSTPRAAIGRTAGMVVAALRLRVSDLAAACWRPADRVLASRTWSNIVVAVPTAAVTWVFFRHGGEVEVLRNTESIAVIGAAGRGLIKLGRWWRNVAPPARKNPDRPSGQRQR
ncbi:MAG: hypothetical protein ACJ786_08105 [Catenulispora sp.]